MPSKPKPKPVTSFPSIVGPDGSLPTFMCGNHTPPHVAKKIKKMVQLHQTKGCTKFYPVPPPSPLGGNEP